MCRMVALSAPAPSGQSKMIDLLASFWEDILSSQPDRIRWAFDGLSPDEQQKVLDHLQGMTSEPGWHPAQVKSAEIAIQVIQVLFG